MSDNVLKNPCTIVGNIIDGLTTRMVVAKMRCRVGSIGLSFVVTTIIGSGR